MKSFYYLLGAAAIALASCSESTELETNPINNLAAKGTAVSFGTYQAQSTRAGETGSMTTAALKKSKGFGVFAYYTEEKDWSAAGATATPNWMWNQQVKWSDSATDPSTGATGGAWTYAPVKFWPNDNQTADDSKATGTTSSKISFFAYAPYVGDETTGAFSPATGETGISALTQNGIAGNPKVTYTLAKTGKTVDLLWGTGVTKYSTVTGSTIEGKLASSDALAATNIDIVKLPTGQKIKFNFKHALAKIGGSPEKANPDVPGSTDEDTKHGLQVQLDIDKDGAITGGDKPDVTKVTIKTIKIENNAGAEDYNGDGKKGAEDTEGLDKIFSTGTLDLATGKWDIDKNSAAAVIDHEITSPASSEEEISASAATIADNLAEPASVAKTAEGFDGLKAGVLTTPQNVYKEETNPLVFIPGTKPSFKVTIEYVVRTKDAHLKDGYSEATQKISKMVSFPNVELNKKYNLIMHLGLTSIKFTASVENWESTDAVEVWNDLDNDGVKDEGEVTYSSTQVDLPINVAD